MTDRKPMFRKLSFGASLSAFALLAACGGGGGVSSTPSPSPTPTPSPSPTPSPTPTPTPTPTSSFNTTEYRQSDGPQVHNAIAAWQDGTTGQGQTIAIVDTGIDSDSPEFAGRIHPDSQDVASNRSVDGDDDHGTHVALVAAAARDNTGILGIAFDATILALRADEPGSCLTTAPGNTENSCSFYDADIAAGVDQAIASGAKVINLSLGGGAPEQVLRNAVARAAAADIVVVVSAGNDGDGSNPDIDPDQPDPFASGLFDAGNGNVIIVGSVTASGEFSDFSNKAGNYADGFISALGEEVCCVYEDGVLKVETIGGSQYVTVFSGTSFSAPQVAGAVALLAQAFPNLTAQEIVSILLDSAEDAGAAGIDGTYGVGILDIAEAFQPRGVTSVAGTTQQIAVADDAVVASSAMGDALDTASASTVILDGYRRAYTLDLSQRMRNAQQSQHLRSALALSGTQVSGRSEEMALAFTIGDRSGAAGLGWSRQLSLSSEDADIARVLAARVSMKLSPETQVAFGYAQGAEGLVAQMQGQPRPAFLIADTARSDTGFVRTGDVTFAMRHQLGDWGVTFSAEQGEAWLGNFRNAADSVSLQREDHALQSYALAADRQFGPLAATLGLTWMDEDRTVLGSYLHNALGDGGADTLFVDAGASWAISPRWQLGADFRQGYTRARSGGAIASGSDFTSNGWSFDILRTGILQRSDSLGLRIAQPLRVTGGSLLLDLPVSYDYATETVTYGLVPLSLSPTEREVMGEISWRGGLWGGSATTSLFYRHQPGHYAAASADAGVALRWSRQF